MANANTTGLTCTHQINAEPISETVLRAVSERRGCSPLDLPLLYDSIDPDAMNALIASVKRSATGESTVLEFEYAEYAVRVLGWGAVELRPVHSPVQPVIEPSAAD